MGIKHPFTSPKADGGDATKVRPTAWNTDHVIDGDVDFAGFSALNLGNLINLVDTFLELTDTPNAYGGEALKFARVKADETGLEFTTSVPGSGAADFLALTDTPDSYAGFGSGVLGAFVQVNPTSNALQFVFSTAEYLDIRDYGTVVGGGDITAALQAALDAIGTHQNGRIRIPLVDGGFYTCGAISFPTSEITIEIDCKQISLTSTWFIPGGYTVRGMGGRNRNINFPHPYRPLPRPVITTSVGLHPILQTSGQNVMFENLSVFGGGTALYLHSAELVTVRNCSFGTDHATRPAFHAESVFWLQMQNVSAQPGLGGGFAMQFTTDEDWGKNVGIILMQDIICNRNGMLFRSVFGPSGIDNIDIDRYHTEGLLQNAANVTFDSTLNGIGGVWMKDLEASDVPLPPAYFLHNIGPNTDGIIWEGFNVSDLFSPTSTPVKNFVIDFTKHDILTSNMNPSHNSRFAGTTAAHSHQYRTSGAMDVRLLTAPVGLPWTVFTPLPVEQTPANWTKHTGTETITTVLGPDGSSMGGAVTGGTAALCYFNAALVLAQGDMFLTGVWVRNPTAGGVATTLIGMEVLGGAGTQVSFDAGYGGNLVGELEDKIANNGWRWVCRAVRITNSSFTNPCLAQFRLNTGMEYFNPCSILIPAASVALIDEVHLRNLERSLKGGWSSTNLVGEVGFLDHQIVKAGSTTGAGGVKAFKLQTPRATAKTIAAGVITVTGSYHVVDTEAAAATDDLDTINGGVDGQRLVLRASNGARTVVVKDGTGNLQLAGDFSLDNTQDTIELIFDSTLNSWQELGRSDNGA